MKNQITFQNRTAVITGAASGIGQALALNLAQRHCHLALVDRDQNGLQRTVEAIKEPGLRVSCHILDVADSIAVAALPAIVSQQHPGVDLLINNAGVALGGTFEQISDDDFEWLFGINFRGVVWMTRAFLPLLRASNDAWIANLSSIYGIIAPPGQTAYAASKFAVRGFSEALRHELHGSNIGVSVIHPGGVATAIADHARFPAGTSSADIARDLAEFKKMLSMPPPVAAEIIIRGIEQRKSRILVGRDAEMLAMITRIVPVAYWWLVERLL